MKANELRIGNYVEVYLPPQISEWIETKVDLNALHGIIENPTTHGYKPIPLTEEWLLKFGFEKSGLYHVKNQVYIHDEHGWTDTGYEYRFNYTSTKIKHVHQLQNLYFALTGTEITLNETK